jgi:imidazolonepropionase-like amidohydrolase
LRGRFNRPAQQTPAAPLVIRGVTLIDGTGRGNVANATVVVEGTRITQAGANTLPMPAGAQITDGRGKFLIPGLIDVHVHLAGGGNRANVQPITPQQELARRARAPHLPVRRRDDGV